MNSSSILPPNSKKISQFKKFLIYAFYFSLSPLNSVLSNRSKLTSAPQQIEALTNDLVIYVTYSKDGKIAERELKLIAKVQSEGFSCFVVVNHDDSRITPFIRNNSSRDSNGVYFFLRKNVGWDLGAYRDISSILLNTAKTVTFLNSSMIYSDKDISFLLKSAIDMGNRFPYSVIGVSESTAPWIHLQSFFYHFPRELVSREIPHKVFSKVKNHRFKRLVVTFGELQFSKTLNGLEIDFRALWPYQRTIDFFKNLSSNPMGLSEKNFSEICERIDSGVRLNPTIHMYPVFLHEYGILKKSILRDNPANFSDATLKAVTEYF